MNFYKNNAYPEIFLHDCFAEVVHENENLKLIFGLYPEKRTLKENTPCCRIETTTGG